MYLIQTKNIHIKLETHSNSILKIYFLTKQIKLNSIVICVFTCYLHSWILSWRKDWDYVTGLKTDLPHSFYILLCWSSTLSHLYVLETFMTKQHAIFNDSMKLTISIHSIISAQVTPVCLLLKHHPQSYNIHLYDSQFTYFFKSLV